MRAQRIVAAYLEEHDLQTDPAYRLLDLAAEVGEVAGDAAKSSDYGADPDALEVATDELGDALFSLLALAESLDADAEAALEEALDKYERRMAAGGEPSSDVEENDGSRGGERTRYHKLVRDDIPEIVEENGQTPIAREAGDEEYAGLLGEKLVEEAREFRESGDLEELADVLAVVDAVREHRGVPEATLRDLEAEKAAERGRFEERIVLEAVREPRE